MVACCGPKLVVVLELAPRGYHLDPLGLVRLHEKVVFHRRASSAKATTLPRRLHPHKAKAKPQPSQAGWAGNGAQPQRQCSSWFRRK
jgi:hypothetical protein